MSSVAIGLIAIIILLLMLAVRVPIAFALSAVSVVGMMIIRGPNAAVSVLAEQPYRFIAHWSMSAIPMFLLMGAVAYHAGLTSSLYRAARLWLSALPGGLAVASTAACAMFAAASGSSVATASAMGKIAIPEMLRYKYDAGLATGSVAAAGTLGSLIPPSILMVLYAIFAEVSVSRALLAGVLPGILSAIMFILMITIRCKLNPSLAPRVDEEISWRQRLDVLREIWPLPVLIFAVIGSLYIGVFTATEAAAGGAFMTLVVAAMRGALNWTVVKNSIKEAVYGTATILFIALGGFLLSRFMAVSGLPNYVAHLVDGLNVSGMVVVVGASFVYLILGMFLDSIGIMLLTLPIMLPVLEAAKLDLVWFGVLVIKYLEIGLITPPVGLNVFVIKSVVGKAIPLEVIFKGVMWFIATDIVTLAILIAFPEISLFLPRIMN
ncbi:MAG: TRAP transporter large permease [Pseudolabrys sp.]|nr:TRAP transporter large permease [Pseudolabrys sp.]MDP2298921.1 TRAP transporter large permease [Pseudolabrys sp.]